MGENTGMSLGRGRVRYRYVFVVTSTIDMQHLVFPCYGVNTCNIICSGQLLQIRQNGMTITSTRISFMYVLVLPLPCFCSPEWPPLAGRYSGKQNK